MRNFAYSATVNGSCEEKHHGTVFFFMLVDTSLICKPAGTICSKTSAINKAPRFYCQAASELQLK